MPRNRHLVFRDGHVHVCSELCSTCVFRKGNLMQLQPGRVRDMVDEARRNDSTIVCHQTLNTGKEAGCRGFFDRFPTTPLQLAFRLGLVKFVDPNTIKED